MSELKIDGRQSWDKESKEIVIKNWVEGMPAPEIGRLIGRTGNAITSFAVKFGLPRRDKRSAISIEALKTGKVRKCLCCTQKFWSEHNGNRICVHCKNNDQGAML